MDVLELVRDELIDADLGLSSATCYVSAVTAFVAGSEPFYVQVIDNGESLEGEQGGNAFGRRVSVKVSVFVHMSLDQEHRSEQALIKAAVGLRTRALAIRGLLNGNWLEAGRPVAAQLVVPLYWSQTFAPVCQPSDPQWVSQDLVFVGQQYSRSSDANG